ncbi:MAG: glycosyltransferase [Syntrophobacteraceae bacterium]
MIINGVDASKFNARENYNQTGKIRCAVVASMTRPMKGHEDFLKAAALTEAKRSDRMSFFLVGGGHLRPHLEEMAARLGLNGQVHFLGERTDVPSILESIDILVVPSHSEGMSNALLEAMAAGLPAVATAVDGNNEVVVDQETGILVPARDPEAMSDALLRYLDNPRLMQLHGRNARRRIEEKFTLDQSTEAYLKAYHEAMDLPD